MRKLRLLGFAMSACIISAPVQADDDHPELPEAVKAFHDTLSPNWHSPAGAARNAAACQNAGRYVDQSDAIGKQPAPPEVDSRAWSRAVLGLRDASVALRASCTAGNDAKVVAGLTTLHDRFHDLMKALRPAPPKAD